MMNRHPLLSGLIAVSAVASVAPAATSLYDFNNANQLPANFASRGGGTNYNASLTGGLANTGAAVAVSSNGISTLVDQTDSVSLAAVGSGTRLAAFFQAAAAGRNGSGPSVTFELGVTANKSTGYFEGIPNALSARINTNGNVLEFGVNSVAANGFTPVSFNGYNGPSGSGVTLAGGNWYYLAFTITPLGNNTLGVSASLYNSDASGTVGSKNGSTINRAYYEDPNGGFGNLYNNTAVGAAFRGALQPNGPTNGVYGGGVVDDFSVTTGVPEPTTLALVVAGGLALRRRRA